MSFENEKDHGVERSGDGRENEKFLSAEQSADIREAVQRLTDSLAKVIAGKDDVLRLVCVGLLADGHILLDDVPGTGKTTLARAMAKSLGVKFARVQFTPDLLPSELSGINYYRSDTNQFEFRPGAVFTNILLADEINRATPRTQSSLLECMQEKQVSVDGVTYELKEPFWVIATQNPLETLGTFPLPEAQLDRFMMRLSLGYPDKEAERVMLRRFRGDSPLDTLEPVLSGAELLKLRRLCRNVYVAPVVEDYLLAIVRGTRESAELQLGASPRALLALRRAAQVLAAIEGAAYVSPDPVAKLAVPVLAHRVIPRSSFLEQTRALSEGIIADIVAAVPVPTEAYTLPEWRN